MRCDNNNDYKKKQHTFRRDEFQVRVVLQDERCIWPGGSSCELTAAGVHSQWLSVRSTKSKPELVYLPAI